MTKSASSHAWDLYDIITDFAFAYPQLLHERMPRHIPYDGSNNGVTHTTYRYFMWDAIMEFFLSDFDMEATMEALCDSYGVPNIYEREGEEV